MQKAGRWRSMAKQTEGWSLSFSPSGSQLLICIPGQLMRAYSIKALSDNTVKVTSNCLVDGLLAVQSFPQQAAFCSENAVAVLGSSGQLQVISTADKAEGGDWCFFSQQCAPGDSFHSEGSSVPVYCSQHDDTIRQLQALVPIYQSSRILKP